MTEFVGGRPSDEVLDIPDGMYYTAQEFAELLDVSETRVRVWINRGQLDSYRWYGRIYIPVDAKVRFKWPWKRV